MEVKDLFAPLFRWWWLLLASTLVAGLTSLIVASREPPLYKASTTLMIGRAINDPNPSGGEFQLSQQLASIYADIAERGPVALATMEALGIDWLPDYNARALPNSQFLEIAVVDTIPEIAQAVADELARQLILQSPTAPQEEELARQEFIAGQLNYLEEKIAETQDEITAKQSELAEMVSARQIADTQQAISALQAKLATLQANYAALLANTTSGATNTLSVIEYAALPTRPVAPDVPMVTLLAAAVGFALAAAGAYLIEYLDDTVRTTEDVARVVELPVIASIPTEKVLMERGSDPGLFPQLGNTLLAEALRTLRTNLEFSGVLGAPRTLLVAGPGAGHGVKTVATQLAAAFAHAGKRVALVDANLRRPALHSFLRIGNKLGLSDMLQDDLVPQVVAQDTKLWRLKVISAGKQAENAAELLGSLWLLKAFARLREQAEVVILVGPPFLVAESFVLAARVERVLIVLRPGLARRAVAEAMMEQLERVKANLVGIVLNGISRRKAFPMARYTPFASAPDRTNGAKPQPAPARRPAGTKPEEKKQPALLDVDQSTDLS